MDVMPSGKAIELKDVHFLKAEAPMDVMPSGKVIELKEVHP